nr:MAG TPA: hypothetical protein [Caudoviricetes sp.]
MLPVSRDSEVSDLVTEALDLTCQRFDRVPCYEHVGALLGLLGLDPADSLAVRGELLLDPLGRIRDTRPVIGADAGVDPAGLYEGRDRCDNGRETGQTAERGDDLGGKAHDSPRGTCAPAVPKPRSAVARASQSGAV